MTKNAQNLYNLEKHLQKDNLCFKCNNLNENINTFSVKAREFGSIFQGDKFTINLCNECQKLIKEEWFNNNPVNIENDFCFYTEEHELINFIKSFPIENQEYIFNCDNDMLPSLDRNTWIELNTDNRQAY